jgi:four helix bundle protein
MKIYDIGERTFAYSVSIVRFVVESQPKHLEYSIYDQVLRSATSIGANVQEGRASSSRKEFIRYYEIALRSANETTYWLKLMVAGLKVENDQLSVLIIESEELARILAASILRLKATSK